MDKGRYTRSRYHRDKQDRYDSYQSVILEGGGRREERWKRWTNVSRFWNLISEPYISFRLDWIERAEVDRRSPFLFLPSKCHRFFQANGSTTLLSAKCITFRGRFNAEFLSKCKVLTGYVGKFVLENFTDQRELISLHVFTQYLWQYKSYLIFANSADFLIDDQRCSFDPAMTNLIWKILFFVNSLSLKFYSFVISLSFSRERIIIVFQIRFSILTFLSHSILLFLDLSHQKLPSPLSFSFILDESHFSKNKRILNRVLFPPQYQLSVYFPLYSR